MDNWVGRKGGQKGQLAWVKPGMKGQEVVPLSGNEWSEEVERDSKIPLCLLTTFVFAISRLRGFRVTSHDISILHMPYATCVFLLILELVVSESKGMRPN